MWFQGRNTIEIRTEIQIDAPVEKVWSILMDINKWHEWSPIINKSKGEMALGSKLDITMIGDKNGEDGPNYGPIISKLDAPSYFEWTATMMAGFIFTNGKIIQLEKNSSGGTRVIHKETFTGMMAPIMCGKMEEGVPPMLNSMNEALKKKSEQN